jgi:hypothetical protein
LKIKFNEIKNLDYLYAFDGTCDEKKCDKMCTQIYEPVCAYGEEQTISFSNQCSLDVKNCETSNGEMKFLYLNVMI